jgi:hypothetical protein
MQNVSEFLVPSSDVIVLTDANKTAAVYGTATSPFGTMLSHGATKILFESWFGTTVNPMTHASSKAQIDHSAAQQWATGHPGLEISVKPPAAQAVHVEQIQAGRQLQIGTLKPVKLSPGRLMQRQIQNHKVYYHEAATAMSPNVVPRIDAPLSISADQSITVAQLRARPAPLVGNKCAGCAGCAVCAGCAFCAEVNFYVGAVGFVGLVGLIGLASSVLPIEPTGVS